MTPAIAGSSQPTEASPGGPATLAWPTIIWVALLLLAGYAPVLGKLVANWNSDPDMGHGFFVPIIAGYIAWKKRSEIAGVAAETNWWGLAVMIWGALQYYVGTLGAELFLTRTSLVITIIGTVLLVGGTRYLRIFAFPLFLLFFMVPIPAIIYNQITFPLQLLASRAAEGAITLLQIPVIREGNVLELSSQKLNVVEACSGIRSLLTLTFLSLVYGYFFETRGWLRVLLFCSTVPIAIVANAGRVALTGVLSEFKPELAEGLFHEAEGWVIFMVALFILVTVHQGIVRIFRLPAGVPRI